MPLTVLFALILIHATSNTTRRLLAMTEVLYCPTDNIRRHGRVSVVYGKSYPMAGYVPVTIIPHSHYSHWSEDIIGESNHCSLLRDYEDSLIIIDYADGEELGYVGRYDETCSGDLCRIVNALMDYPLYDEADYSELVLQRQDEYISSDGILDFHHTTDDRWEHETDKDIVIAIWQAISDIGAEWDGTMVSEWDNEIGRASCRERV